MTPRWLRTRTRWLGAVAAACFLRRGGPPVGCHAGTAERVRTLRQPWSNRGCPASPAFGRVHGSWQSNLSVPVNDRAFVVLDEKQPGLSLRIGRARRTPNGRRPRPWFTPRGSPPPSLGLRPAAGMGFRAGQNPPHWRAVSRATTWALGFVCPGFRSEPAAGHPHMVRSRPRRTSRLLHPAPLGQTGCPDNGYWSFLAAPGGSVRPHAPQAPNGPAPGSRVALLSGFNACRP